MDGGNEQRVAIKFYFKTGLSARNTSIGAKGTFLDGILDFETEGNW
jgi:hypothetical protein